MSRVVHLNLDERAVAVRCHSEQVGISVIEALPAGGVRLVCMSSVGAALIRRKLKANVIHEPVTRERHRPVRPLW